MGWAFYAPHLALALLTACIVQKNANDTTKAVARHPLLVWIVIGWFALCWLLFFPTFLALGCETMYRIRNQIYAFFLAGCCLAGAATGARLALTGQRTPRYLVIAAQCVLLAGLLGQSNFRRAARDLLTRARPYHEQWSDRYSILREAANRGETEVHLPALQAVPWTISFNEKMDPRYFGLEVISIEGLEPNRAPTAAGPSSGR